MASNASTRFNENKQDIAELWRIHEEVGGSGRGRKYGVDVLNRAAIVFITACWESFVEDLATEAFDFMLANVPAPNAVPSQVRDHATRPIFEQKDSRRVWDLADSGWRDLLTAHRDATLERWLGHFNTPKAKQVDDLFDSLLGLKQISNKWYWQRMTAATARSKLDDYVTARGNIAHRTEHETTVHKSLGNEFLGHVERLVEKCDAAVIGHLSSTCGKPPW